MNENDFCKSVEEARRYIMKIATDPSCFTPDTAASFVISALLLIEYTNKLEEDVAKVMATERRF